MRGVFVFADVQAQCFFFSSRRRHTRLQGDWSSDVCSYDLVGGGTPLRLFPCLQFFQTAGHRCSTDGRPRSPGDGEGPEQDPRGTLPRETARLLPGTDRPEREGPLRVERPRWPLDRVDRRLRPGRTGGLVGPFRRAPRCACDRRDGWARGWTARSMLKSAPDSARPLLAMAAAWLTALLMPARLGLPSLCK